MGVAFDGQNSVPVEFRQLHGVKHSFLVFPDQFQNIGIQGQVFFCCKILDDLFHPLWNRQIHSVIVVFAELVLVLCSMDFKIYNQLTAEVTAETDIPADGKKVFTLYHGYDIKKILDENGNKVPFLREGDFVYIDLINETRKITFIYRGHSPKFYSNYQGSLLLGGFCYYPMPGFLQVYQTKTYNTVFNIPKDDIEFDVTVHTTNTVYSNLNCNGKNSFSGKAQTVSLVSGMYYEQKTDGIRVLSAGTNSFFDDAELKKQYDIIQDKQVIKGKTIIIVPNVNETFDNVFSRDTVLMCGFATGIGDSVNNSVGNESSNLS